ncbi:MAG: hypothetical protein H7X89_08175 [Rhizobiales bacterium]|nr:hypothetical protein [Hyphomicrobiales bacterium]
MTVVVVRSSIPCEPDCPQWIAAEGRITAQTPAVFKKALKLAGKKRLPVIVNSPGGDVDAALAIGTMIRARKLDVAVGWTAFTGCAPGQKDCKPAVYRGTVFTYGSYCASACPFILAGGQQRLLGEGALIGVHQISTTMIQDRSLYRERYVMVKGKRKVLSRTLVSRKPSRSYVTTKLGKSHRRKLVAYLKTMGVGVDLIGLFNKAPPSSIYVLEPGEAASTKLVTAFSPAANLVGNHLCSIPTPADNCVKLEPAKP